MNEIYKGVVHQRYYTKLTCLIIRPLHVLYTLCTPRFLPGSSRGDNDGCVERCEYVSNLARGLGTWLFKDDLCPYIQLYHPRATAIQVVVVGLKFKHNN